MGIVGTILKKVKRTPFVFNVQDVFPDSLVTTGIANKGSFLWKFGNWISNISYKNADKIITISNSMKDNLIKKGIPEKDVLTIHNWIDEETIHPITRDCNFLFDELHLPREKFYVVYAGNLGKAQGIDVVVDAAKYLMENKNIQFVVFGNGAQKKELKKRILQENITNIALYDLRASEEISYVYSLGDVSIITCKKGTGVAGLPSKTWSILATATMPIACFDLESELSRLIVDNEIGIAIEPENSQMLKEAVEYAYLNQDKCILMGKKGRKLVENYYSKKSCTDKYINILKDISVEMRL